MAAKKKSPTSDKKTRTPDKKRKSSVKSLESKVARADASADRWKKQAKKHASELAVTQARVADLRKKLDKARAKAKAPSKAPAAAEPRTVEVVPPADDTVSEDASGPDRTWTVAQLRAEARSRGLRGLSNKPKAALLAALS